MSDTLKKSMDELMDYAKGNKESVEIRTYKIEDVPDYNGEKIKEIRNNMSLPRSVLADILGVSVRTIEKWEIDGAKPNGSARRILQMLENNPVFTIKSIEDLAANS